MPTKKPIVQTVLDESNFAKLKLLANNQDRSISNYAGYILKQFIKEYEEKFGEIKIDTPE